MEIIISQNENQNITVDNSNVQSLSINQNDNQNINIDNNLPQEINIKENENQVIFIDGGGNVIGITDVLVNGVSVVSDKIAYVIVPTKLSQLDNDENFITSESDPTVPSYVKTISLADINNWNNKQNALVSGSTIKTINNNSLLGSGNINITANYTAGDGIGITDENVIYNTITSYDDLSDKPDIPTKVSELLNDENYVSSDTLSDVAFSGSYVDLSNTPNIPAFTSDLTNDSDFIDGTQLNTALSSKQDTLVSGTNIKTINNNSILGSGDLVISGGTPTDVQINGTSIVSSNVANIITQSAYNSSTNKIATKNDIPTKTSELNNDSGFIDNSVNNLINYTNNTNLTTLLNNKENKSTTGSNANGTYIKYDNDYMICYGTATLNNLAITGSFEGVYYANTGNITFPETFTTTPNVVVSPLNIAGGGFSFYGVTTSSFNGFVWKTTSSTKNVVFYYLAIGKWR